MSKIQKIDLQNKKNNFLLLLKKTLFEKEYFLKPLKAATCLFDTGWINVDLDKVWSLKDNYFFPVLGTIEIKDLPLDYYFWIENNTYTDKQGDLLPIKINYIIKKNLNFPEMLLPFINSSVMIKKNGDMTIHSIYDYISHVWNKDTNYFRIKGDETLIYQGYNPYVNFPTYSPSAFPSYEITDGNILTENTSQWFGGSLKYHHNAEEWELRNGWIHEIYTYYNISLNPWGTGYNYETFTCAAIDALSSSRVSGTGTHLKCLWINDEEFTMVTTKNVTLTNIPLFENTTDYSTILTVQGYIYKDGVYQTNWGYIDFKDTVFVLDEWNILEGTFKKYVLEYNSILIGRFNSLTLAEIERDRLVLLGTHDIDKFQITNYNFLLKKLWFSDKRACSFNFNMYDTIESLPDTSNYQTETLPYTNITVETNPVNFPVLLEEQNHIHSFKQPIKWLKKSKSYENECFALQQSGNIIFTLPADNVYETTCDYMSDIYTPGGGTYSKTTHITDPKNLSRYSVTLQDIQVRYKINFINPFKFNLFKKRKNRAS
jgi:hypothetical protein